MTYTTKGDRALTLARELVAKGTEPRIAAARAADEYAASDADALCLTAETLRVLAPA